MDIAAALSLFRQEVMARLETAHSVTGRSLLSFDTDPFGFVSTHAREEPRKFGLFGGESETMNSFRFSPDAAPSASAFHSHDDGMLADEDFIA